MHSTIDSIIATEVTDSRGNPTLMVSVSVGEYTGTFSVPSGASTGAHEAYERRDADGHGVTDAITAVNTIIAPALIGKDVTNQQAIDTLLCTLDGTPHKDRLGANALIGVSIAVAKTAAEIKGVPVYKYLRTLTTMAPSRRVPLLYMNLLNGGKHATNGLAFQEYHIVPETEDVQEAIAIGIRIQERLAHICDLDLGTGAYSIGDEGGLAPQTHDVIKPLVYLARAVDEEGLAGKVRLALDVAASSFFDNGAYIVGDEKLSADGLHTLYRDICAKFDMISIEDPFDEESFSDFARLKQEERIRVVGDDLTVTNVALLQQAITSGSINAMIIKPNQIGTLSETLATMALARTHNIDLIVSHRSGETMDDFIADLAYAFGCFGLKAGSPTKPERMVKYKRLHTISTS